MIFRNPSDDPSRAPSPLPSTNMADARKRKEPGKVCAKCGSTGYINNLVTCSGCKKISEHIYCMKICTLENPKVWYCGDCQSAAEDICERVQDVCKKKKPVHPNFNTPFVVMKSSKVKYIPFEEIDRITLEKGRGEFHLFNPSSLQNYRPKALSPPHLRTVTAGGSTSSQSMKAIKDSGSMATENSIIDKRQDAQMNKTLALYTDEKLRIISRDDLETSKEVGDGGSSADAKVDSLLLMDIENMKSGSSDIVKSYSRVQNENLMSGSQLVLTPYGEQPTFDVQAISLPSTSLTVPTKSLPSHCASEACWKGTFEVSFGNGCYEIYGGFEAFLSNHASAKVSEFSRYLPRNLELNSFSSKDAWPRAFRLDPPDHEDIGFYFFPNKIERSKEEYSHLVEKIDLGDFAMQFMIGKVELLIYSSSQLSMDCQRTYENNYYLWGFFRHIRQQKHYQYNLESSLCSPAELKNGCCQAVVSVETKAKEVDMEIDMIGGKEVDQINIPLPRVDAPPGFLSAEYSCPSQKNTPSNVSFKTNIQTNSDVPPVNSRILELSRISSQGARTQAQDCSIKDNKFVSDNTYALPKLFQVTSSCNANVEPSRSTHAALVKSNGLCSPENHTYEKVQLSGKKLHHTRSPSFSSSISYDQGLHESFAGLDDEASNKSIVPLSMVHSHIWEIKEEEDTLSAIIDAPPGFTSRIYSHSSRAIIPQMNCSRTRNLLIKDVPPGFPEIPDSKEIIKLQGATFEDFHPKDILSHTLDAPPGFNNRDYSHSSCTEGSPIECSLKKRSVVKRDGTPGFLKTSNLNDIVRSIAACGKPRQVDNGCNTFVEHARNSRTAVMIKEEDFN